MAYPWPFSSCYALPVADIYCIEATTALARLNLHASTLGIGMGVIALSADLPMSNLS